MKKQKREKCYKPEDFETIEVSRSEFAALLKIRLNGIEDLSRLENEAFENLLNKFVDAYNGKSIDEASDYFLRNKQVWR